MYKTYEICITTSLFVGTVGVIASVVSVILCIAAARIHLSKRRCYWAIGCSVFLIFLGVVGTSFANSYIGPIPIQEECRDSAKIIGKWRKRTSTITLDENGTGRLFCERPHHGFPSGESEITWRLQYGCIEIRGINQKGMADMAVMIVQGETILAYLDRAQMNPKASVITGYRRDN